MIIDVTSRFTSEESDAEVVLPESQINVCSSSSPEGDDRNPLDELLPGLEDSINHILEELKIDISDGEITLPQPSVESLITVLSTLSDRLEGVYKATRNLDLIEESIRCRRQCLLLISEGNPSHSRLLKALGRSLQLRFENLGDPLDIEEAIRHQTVAIALIGNNGEEKATYLAQLGVLRFSRFERLGDLADIDKAIECQAQSVQLTPHGHPDMPRLLNNLGSSWQSRFERLGDLADIDKAIECQAQSVQLTPHGHPSMPGRLSNLGNSWQSRFERLGDLADIDKAIECHTQSVQLTPHGHPDMPGRLSNLGNSWLCRFQRLGDLADIDKAIECHTQSVQLTPHGHPDMPSRLSNLGVSWSRRFQRLGDLADIDKAIECYTQSVQLTPHGHPDMPGRLSNLGVSWQSRFERLGDLADIDKAIECYTQSVQLTPHGHPDMPGRLSNLGVSWSRRFERLGDLADIDKAIECCTQSVQLTPHGHPNMSSRLSNLGNSWQSRFERLGDLADIDKAIECCTQSVQLTPHGHPNMSSRLSNLGNSWKSRFERLGDLADIDKAIECYTQSVQLTPHGHPDMPGRLNNLGSSWQSRFEQLGDLANLDKAIECRVCAVQLTPEGHAYRPSFLSGLGECRMRRFQRLDDPSDLESARKYFKEGAEHTITNPRVQIVCARQWALCSIVVGLSPLPAYQRAFALLPRLVWLGLSMQARYSTIEKISDLAAEAAAWAVGENSHDLAIEWLEAGRSIVWSQILQLRTSFDDLAVIDPRLANRLKETAFKLETAGSRIDTAESHPKHQADLESQARCHRRLAYLWEELLAKVRQLPGFHEYLLPRKSQQLKKAATDGPVVIVNTHYLRCDALIMLPQCEDVIHVPLATLSEEKLADTRAGLFLLTGHRGNRDEARGVKRDKTTPNPEDQFGPLAALWSDVVGPVLDALTYTRKLPYSELPHITWCATGALSFLPLHAAGLYNGLSPNAFDLVVSSYTPTLSALLPQNTRDAAPPDGILAVGQANTPGLSRLPKTVDELAIVKKYSQSVRFRQLDGALATVNATLSAMEAHSWVHLACHGVQNRANPSHSAFYLHDGPLALEEIARREFKNKGLAFLSACQTATGDDVLPDEATHLAAGMLMAGYPTVIATMWSIKDADAPEIAEEVYAELMKDGKMDHTNTARALHKAVGKLREKVGAKSIGRWAPFVHIGV